MTVQDRLNNLISERGTTMKQVAVRAGIPYSTVKNICYGDSKNPGVYTIQRICRVFDMSLSEFFEGI